MRASYNMLLSSAPRIIKNIVPRGIKLWITGKFKSIRFYIDIVGFCNLRCPSCCRGQGNMSAHGLMDIALFERIIEKIKREYPGSIICLFNWTEPFLHPDLPKFIRLVRNAGLDCNISTNLNSMRNLDEVLFAKPSNFKISLSGFSQEVYEIGHRGGNIDRVKDNMKVLSESIKRIYPRLKVCVHYHKYNYNLHELEEMKRYASSLGFGFMPSWAFHMPVESALDYAQGISSCEQKSFIENRYALRLDKALDATKPYRRNPCTLLEYMAIDYEGNIVLCCAVSERVIIGHFLNLSPKQIKEKKHSQQLCYKCKANGLHVFYTYHGYPQLCVAYEQIAKETLDRKNSV